MLYTKPDLKVCYSVSLCQQLRHCCTVWIKLFVCIHCLWDQMSIYCIPNKYEVNHVQYMYTRLKYGWELNPLTFELQFVKMMLYHLVLMVWCDVIYNNNYINVVDGRASNAPGGTVELNFRNTFVKVAGLFPSHGQVEFILYTDLVWLTS